MSKQKQKYRKDEICLNPEQRLCPEYDSTSIRMQLSAQREEMGIPIVDNCAQEHMQ